MTVTLAQIRQGVSDRLATISGLQASPYMRPRIEAPAACVIPSRAEFDQTMNSDDTDYHLSAWLYVSPTDLVKAQQEIDLYMAPSGTQSFRAAIDAAPTLGIPGVYCYVEGWTSYASLVDVAGSQMLGAELQLKVTA